MCVYLCEEEDSAGVPGSMLGVGACPLPKFLRGNLVENTPPTCSCSQVGLLVTHRGLGAACLKRRTLRCPQTPELEMHPWEPVREALPGLWAVWPSSRGLPGCPPMGLGGPPSCRALGCLLRGPPQLRGGNHHTTELEAPDISPKSRNLCRTVCPLLLRR